MFHHDSEEADDDLGAGPDQHLSLAALLGIADGLEGISQHVHAHHVCNLWLLTRINIETNDNVNKTENGY